MSIDNYFNLKYSRRASDTSVSNQADVKSGVSVRRRRSSWFYLVNDSFRRIVDSGLFTRWGMMLVKKKVSGYGGAKIEPWSKDWRFGVISYMKMMLDLYELEYWKAKLSFDKKRFG